MAVRRKEVEELQSQAQALSQEGKSTDEVDGQRIIVEKKFVELLAPLNDRKSHLLASKEIHQFNRDVEDEIVSFKKRTPPHPIYRFLFPGPLTLAHWVESNWLFC